MGAIVLGLAMFLGDDMYHSYGLHVLRSPFDRYDTDYIVQYCWSHLTHYDPERDVSLSLYHYAYFPYIMFTMSTGFYLVHISWRFSTFNQLSHGTFWPP